MTIVFIIKSSVWKGNRESSQTANLSFWSCYLRVLIFLGHCQVWLVLVKHLKMVWPREFLCERSCLENNCEMRVTDENHCIYKLLGLFLRFCLTVSFVQFVVNTLFTKGKEMGIVWCHSKRELSGHMEPSSLKEAWRKPTNQKNPLLHVWGLGPTEHCCIV